MPALSQPVPSRPAPLAPERDPAPEPLLIFDALGPFFAGTDIPVDTPINWSKIPFANFERDGVLDADRVETVLAEFDRHVTAMAATGYNALAIDDLAHLAVHPWYPEPLRRKLGGYRELYERAFAIAAARGLRVFVITDYWFGNPDIRRHLAATGASETDFFAESVRLALGAWRGVAGVIVRIGESDGVDVDGDFTSQLAIRRPADARALVERLLPIFEAHGATLVVRTWTLGAYPVGDLSWNARTWDAVFGGLDSPNLIVSLKYADADFFRFLELNPLFFHGPQRKLIEFQCRREYEGMGEYPSFVGWLHAGYLEALGRRPANVVGILSLQGGGWAPFRRLAFCGDGAPWNELNALVTQRLAAAALGSDPDAPRDLAAVVEMAVAGFCQERGIADVAAFLRLLRLADEAIERGLYIREFAERPLYFQRVRIPSLTWVFWNNVTTGGLVSWLHRARVRDKAAAVRDGHRAVAIVREMLAIARELGLPERDFRFQLRSFEVLALLRESLLGVDTAEGRAQLEDLAVDYRRAFPAGYVFDTRPSPRARLERLFSLAMPLIVRERKAYRRADRVLLSPRVARVRASVTARLSGSLPAFVNRQGMSTDVLTR